MTFRSPYDKEFEREQEIEHEAYQRGANNILGKIKTEIETLNPIDYVSMSSYEGHRGASDMKDDVLQIIDKYMKWSEEA